MSYRQVVFLEQPLVGRSVGIIDNGCVATTSLITHLSAVWCQHAKPLLRWHERLGSIGPRTCSSSSVVRIRFRIDETPNECLVDCRTSRVLPQSI